MDAIYLQYNIKDKGLLNPLHKEGYVINDNVKNFNESVYIN